MFKVGDKVRALKGTAILHEGQDYIISQVIEDKVWRVWLRELGEPNGHMNSYTASRFTLLERIVVGDRIKQAQWNAFYKVVEVKPETDEVYLAGLSGPSVRYPLSKIDWLKEKAPVGVHGPELETPVLKTTDVKPPEPPRRSAIMPPLPQKKTKAPLSPRAFMSWPRHPSDALIILDELK